MTQTFNPDLSGGAVRPTRSSPRVKALAEPKGAPGTEGSGDHASARRGPFRPGVWLSSRQRSSARLAGHAFHLIDLAVLWAITLYWIASSSGTSLTGILLVNVLPLAGAALFIQAMMPSLGIYRFDRNHQLPRHLLALGVLVCLAAVLAQAATLVLTVGTAIPLMGWLVTTLASLFALHCIWSLLVGRWRQSGALTPNIVVVGATRHAERLIHLALQRRDLNVLGVFDDRLARSPDAVAGVPVLGRAEDLLKHRMIPYVDRIVVAIDPNAHARVREMTARLQVLPTEVSLLVDPQGDTERDAALDRLARAPLAPLVAPRSPDRRAFNKRLQDVLVGSLAMVLASPIIGLVALAVRLDSPGPIFFRQRRHGFNHEEIVVWKFRSMRHDAADPTASRQVCADDDRITRVGRFLRSTSLDELPQLLNVLKGEMSLVGPRPHAIGMKTGQIESAALVADYAHRHRMKPGMTGWAAINGSRGPLADASDVRRRVQLDVDYIERQSFWLDLWIMAATVPVLLGDRVAVR